MAQNNTQDQGTLASRRLAMKIIFYGFDDGDLATIISTGQSAGFADNTVYSTGTPDF